MILVTGAFGFIGSHTARALLDAGQPCVLARHRAAAVPDFLVDDVATGRAVVAEVDVRDRTALLALGDAHALTGIVHLGGALSADPFAELRDAMVGLANVLEAAATWRVARVTLASAIGIYGLPRDDAPVTEAAAIALAGAPHPIVAMKKATEVYAESVAPRASLPCVVARIAAVYGPRHRAMRSVVSRIARTAATRVPLDLSGIPWATGADDGVDWCYVKDCARALALLQTAPALRHRVYNVASGQATRNRAFVAAARAIAPDAPAMELPASAAPALPALVLDIARLRDDTGYVPQWSVVDGMRDYIAWLAGHEW
jgi:UDP-glucose 4-epimerase